MRMSDWSSEVCSSDLLGGVSELEQHPIDPVERFGNFLDHQHVIGEIGKPGRADHAGEDREVEGGGGAAAEAGLKPLAIVRGEPREAARHRHVAAGAVDVDRHRPVRRPPDPAGVERTEKEAGIRIAEIRLGVRRRAERIHRSEEHPDRTIAAAAAPRSEEHTYELQSLMRISYAVFFLTKKKK